MNLVDSSGWIEYFNDGPNSGLFEPILKNQTELLISSVNIFEVMRIMLKQKDLYSAQAARSV